MKLMDKVLGRKNLIFYFLWYTFILQVVIAIVLSNFTEYLTLNQFNNYTLLIVNTIGLIYYFLKNKTYLKEEFIKYKKQAKTFFIKIVKWQFIIYFGNMIISLIVLEIFGLIESENQMLVAELVKDNIFISFFSIVVFAPLVEELVFRASIFGMFSRKKAMILSSILFGLMHVAISVFSGNYMDLTFFFSYAFIGFCLSMCYVESETIASPIILHGINNFIGFLVILLTI